MSSFWGEFLHLSLFGESHGTGIGFVLDNLPAGQYIDIDDIKAFMKRRAPGQTPWSTPRKESDLPQILSGFYRDRTTGTPFSAIIKNQDTISKDYRNLETIPRPGHADYTGMVRYRGANDPRGGGHFSGRLTAPITMAGAICLQILKRQGIEIHAHIKEIAGIADDAIDMANPDIEALQSCSEKSFPVLSDEKGQQMADAVEEARLAQDSVGGIVELYAWGLPVGIGDPMFGGLEPKIASFIYAIPAVKALSFGAGIDAVRSRGSLNNDPMFYEQDGEDKVVSHRSNNAGGLDGGITNGMPIVFKVGIKPTSSISIEQESVDLSTESDSPLVVKGRHDPCIVPRALPVIEAATAIVLLDALLLSGRFDYEKDGHEIENMSGEES